MCNTDVCRHCPHYETKSYPDDGIYHYMEITDNKQETIERLKRQVKCLSDENVNLQTKVKHLNQMGSIFRLDRNESVVIIKGLSDENKLEKVEAFLHTILPDFA